MKTIGFIGGMSWESSLEYYRIANETVKALRGGFSSCPSVLYSVDFAQVERLQHAGDWEALEALMARAARSLEKSGAELIVLCTNTMHLCEKAIRQAVSVPFLHIASATGKRIASQKLKTVGLLGTQFTMEKDFYKAVLLDTFGIQTCIPGPREREAIHRIIYQELVQGQVREASREVFKEVIQGLVERGAEGVILGCTEIPLLLSQADVPVPVFDTTRIHAEEAVRWALG